MTRIKQIWGDEGLEFLDFSGLLQNRFSQERTFIKVRKSNNPLNKVMELFYRELGQGTPIVIMHGLFGSSDNWLTQARMLSSHYRVFSLDLRNHGLSPHDEAFSYPVMVSDLKEFIEQRKLEGPVLIGHSMGGKVAMNFALAHPEMVSKLIVVDMAPKAYDLEHYAILEGLKAIPIESITSRTEADQKLSGFVPDPETRQFLLKNLQRKPEGGFTWKINLPAVSKNLPKIGLDLEFKGKFQKPTLFIRGARSVYIKDDDLERIRTVFPAASLETLDTGHWVQAEKPKEFVEVVEKWLTKN